MSVAHRNHMFAPKARILKKDIDAYIMFIIYHISRQKGIYNNTSSSKILFRYCVTDINLFASSLGETTPFKTHCEQEVSDDLLANSPRAQTTENTLACFFMPLKHFITTEK